MDDILRQPKKRLMFNVVREKMILSSIMPELPKNDEVFKLISLGGFSSIAFIRLLADNCKINNLYASSFTIGKKHIESLDVMHYQGKLKNAYLVVSGIAENNNTEKKYGYFKTLKDICYKNDWKLYVTKNHSKIMLFDTGLGKFVLETSSNLNENPKIEQFSFEQNSELFDFYKKLFEMMFKEGKEIGETKQ